MKSFYKEWLDKLNAENNEAVSSVQRTSVPQSTSAASTSAASTSAAETSTSHTPSLSAPTSRPSQEPIPSTSKTTNPLSQPVARIPASQTDIIFETNELQMIIEKGAFQRQKRFRFQDHLFYVKIKLKNSNEPIPLLKDLLDFIHDGLIYLMDSIKTFYNEKDENICYLTLHQNPMVIGLNSGKIICSIIFV